jgi:hypothetical protein
MFSPRLNGKTIKLRTLLPPIHRDHLVLEGVAPSGAPARVTLDGRRVTAARNNQAILLVQASEVTVRWLRLTGVMPYRNPASQEFAVHVAPGPYVHQKNTPPGPRRIANVQIVDNVFDNRGVPPSAGLAGVNGVTVVGDPEGVKMRISGITIARNTFLHYGGVNGEAVGVWAASQGEKVQGVLIEDNRFDQNEFGIELAARYNGPRLAGTQIIGNTFTGGELAIPFDTVATNGTIDQTLIEDNAFLGVKSAINLNAAAPGQLTGDKPYGDVISNTQIVNNLIHTDNAGIYMQGGSTTTSPPSRVSSVTIENDTIVDDQPGSLFIAIPNGRGASGNLINDVIVRNSILYEPSGSAIQEGNQPVLFQPPDVVTNSLISGPGWAGTNGNITGDPQFVDEPHGDYRLAATSPLINAGTTIGAPGYDLNGARRDAQPDIGAFEFGGVARPLLTVSPEQLGGDGTVTSSPAGITCGIVCSARFDPNTTVTLTAKPDRESRFLGWQHGCSGKARCTGETRQRQIGHGSLRALAPTADKRRTPPTESPAAAAKDLQSTRVAPLGVRTRAPPMRARRLQQPRSGFSFGHAPDGKESRRARGSHPAKALVVFPPPNDASDPGDFGTPMVPRSNAPSPTDQPRIHLLAGILKSAPGEIRTPDLRFRRPHRRERRITTEGDKPPVNTHDPGRFGGVCPVPVEDASGTFGPLLGHRARARNGHEPYPRSTTLPVATVATANPTSTTTIAAETANRGRGGAAPTSHDLAGGGRRTCPHHCSAPASARSSSRRVLVRASESPAAHPCSTLRSRPKRSFPARFVRGLVRGPGRVVVRCTLTLVYRSESELRMSDPTPIPRWLDPSEYSAADHLKSMRGEEVINPEYIKARREVLEAAGFNAEDDDSDIPINDDMSADEMLRRIQKGN